MGSLSHRAIDSPLPRPAPQLLVAPFDGSTAVYDRWAHDVTILNPLAGEILLSDAATIEEFSDYLVDGTDFPVQAVRQSIIDMITELDSLGFCDVTNDYEPTSPPLATCLYQQQQPDTGIVIEAIGEGIGFHSANRELTQVIDNALLGYPRTSTATIHLHVIEQSNGRVFLSAAENWEFSSLEAFLGQLPGVINDIVSRLDGQHLVVHAGGVLTSDDATMILPGWSEAGKSTLTAALVKAGCDYLGDEFIGINSSTSRVSGFPSPPMLDVTSRQLLGVQQGSASYSSVEISAIRPSATSCIEDVDPPSLLVSPTFDPNEKGVRFDRLSPRRALEVLLGSTMNLPIIGQPGWEVLCDLAGSVSVWAVFYGDAREAAVECIDLVSELGANLPIARRPGRSLA